MTGFMKYVATLSFGAMCSFPAMATDEFPIPEGFKSGFEEVNGIKMHYVAGSSGPVLLMVQGLNGTS